MGYAVHAYLHDVSTRVPMKLTNTSLSVPQYGYFVYTNMSVHIISRFDTTNEERRLPSSKRKSSDNKKCSHRRYHTAKSFKFSYETAFLLMIWPTENVTNKTSSGRRRLLPPSPTPTSQWRGHKTLGYTTTPSALEQRTWRLLPRGKSNCTKTPTIRRAEAHIQPTKTLH